MLSFSSWEVFKNGIVGLLESAAKDGSVDPNDTVWRGADGSYQIGEFYDPEDFEADCEYTADGTVSEFIDREE